MWCETPSSSDTNETGALVVNIIIISHYRYHDDHHHKDYRESGAESLSISGEGRPDSAINSPLTVIVNIIVNIIAIIVAIIMVNIVIIDLRKRRLSLLSYILKGKKIAETLFQ